jgi:hypothetical protein
VTNFLQSVYIIHKPKWKEVILMRTMMIALAWVTVMLFAGGVFAADQTRDRSKDQTRTTYQTGTQDQTRTNDQQKSQSKDQTQTRDRVKDGSGKTTK